MLSLVTALVFLQRPPPLALAASEDGATVVTLQAEGKVIVWQVPAGPRPVMKLAAEFQLPQPPPAQPQMFLSPHGSYASISTANRTASVFDLRTKALAIEIRLPQGFKGDGIWHTNGHTLIFNGPAYSVAELLAGGPAVLLPLTAPYAVTKDGRFVAGFSGTGVILAELATGRIKKRFEDALPAQPPIAFSPNNAFLATGSQISKLKVWSIPNAKRLPIASRTSTTMRFATEYELLLPDLRKVIDVRTGLTTRSLPPKPVPPANGILVPAPNSPVGVRVAYWPP